MAITVWTVLITLAQSYDITAVAIAVRLQIHNVGRFIIFGRPFVKRFALCYRTVIMSVCSVCNVGALWPNGWTDQDETCLAGRPRPWPHCVRWGPSSLSPDGAQPPIFGPCLFRPNGCMDQDATWYGGRPWPMRLCVRWGPRNLWPIFIVAKRLVDQDGAWRGGRT